MRADLHADLARDHRHRCQQRQLAAVELDEVDGRVGPLASPGEVVAQGDDRQDPPTRGDELTVVRRRAGVQHVHVLGELAVGDRVEAVVGQIGLDLLLAHLFADLLLFGDGLGAELDALDRDGLLVDHDALLGEGHLVLFLGEVAAGHCLVAVRVGDGLALEAHLFALDRDGRGDVLGDDVLAQPGTPGGDLLGAHVQALLRAGHRVIGVGAGGVLHLAVPVPAFAT